MNQVNITIEQEMNNLRKNGTDQNNNLVALLIHHNMQMARMLIASTQMATMKLTSTNTNGIDTILSLPAPAFDPAKDVPLTEKYSLSIQEAAKYFGIGETRLYDIINRPRGENFILEFGGKTRIKRELFARFLDEVSCIQINGVVLF